ncbi:MAG TPA: metalloregulator ArsR/SmtB family transcription factor [Holophagaceae bacterium]|jgi:ArsR family transcriptional regulator|nr:metalloregulator ArsR/SmtB family transcription factor [Holophagaceae bacterium]
MAKQLDRQAERMKALGHPSRLAVLRLVVRGEPDGTPAGEIQAALKIPASTLSHHLDTLASTGLLLPEKEGTFIRYRADFTELRKLTDYLWEDCCGGGKTCC